MARKLRVQYEGALYHITARGVEQRVIFDDDKDREHFIESMANGVEEYGVRLYLYCLMSNHFHLLLETPSGNLSAFMHKIQTAHTVYYNRRHNRCGHLLQGRFGSKLVDGDEYLNQLSRYIHLNPVYIAANIKKPLGERIRILRNYKWSSFKGYAGLAEGMDFVEEEPLLNMIGGRKKKEKRRNYRRYVEAGLAKSDEEFINILKDSRWGIGDKRFQEGIRDLHLDMTMKVRRPEDVSFRRIDLHLKPKFVLLAVAKEFDINAKALTAKLYGNKARAVAARMLMRYASLNQRDVASMLNMGTGAAVCQQLKSLRKDLLKNRNIADKIAHIEKLLNNKCKDT